MSNIAQIGINLENTVTPFPSLTADQRVNSNTLTAVGQGIQARNIHKLTAEFNNITTPNQTGTYGMGIFGSSIGRVAYNTVNNSYATYLNPDQLGYLFSLNTGFEVACNKALSSGRGFVFDGANPGTLFIGNEMGQEFSNQASYEGLVLRNAGEMGLQGSATLTNDNRWWGPFVNGDTWTYDSFGADSPFWVKDLNPFAPITNDFLGQGNEILINLVDPSVNGQECGIASRQYPDSVNIANTSSQNLYVYEQYMYELEQADSSSQGRMIETHTESESGYQLSVYPNPAKDRLTLSYQISKLNDLTFNLSDLMGKTLQRMDLDIENQEHQLTIGQLPSGIYIGIWKSNTKVLQTDRIIIVK